MERGGGDKLAVIKEVVFVWDKGAVVKWWWWGGGGCRMKTFSLIFSKHNQPTEFRIKLFSFILH